MIEVLLGNENYSKVSLHELESKFKVAQLENKLANLGDDISSSYIQETEHFKKIVSGDAFEAEQKFKDPFQLRSYATQIFCANEIPQVKDKTHGFNRGLLIIPFSAEIRNTDDDFEPYILDKLYCISL